MIAKNNDAQRVLMYETYTSDALRLLLQSFTSQFGGQYPKLRYAELVGLIPDESKQENEPEQSADEIISKIVRDLSGTR